MFEINFKRKEIRWEALTESEERIHGFLIHRSFQGKAEYIQNGLPMI